MEDTDVTLAELRGAFGDAIADAVDALSRREGEEPRGYYARVRGNPLAMAVKEADIADNTAPDRVALLDECTRERLSAKYQHAATELGLAC